MYEQVQTLLSRMEHLRSDVSGDSRLPTEIHASVTQLKDTIVKVQLCRRDEIVNAINRHQHRDVGTPMQKEKGNLPVLLIPAALSDRPVKPEGAQGGYYYYYYY